MQLCSKKPQAIGKIGSTELAALRNYLRTRDASDWRITTRPYQHALYKLSGVFPECPEVYQRYCEYMLDEVLPEVTILGVWFNPMEATIVKHYASQARRVPIFTFESYLFDSPQRWTRYLRDKRVLVMHPFFYTIKQQYTKRHQIWPDQDDILPDFDLLQIRVPQLPSLVEPTDTDWFASLDAMKRQMELLDFDIALVGAGAYSLPLVVHAKKLGKQAIHLGGGTQVYFGIKGDRWEQDSSFQKYFNVSWIRPLPEDTPKQNHLIENGCYW
jgi:hypothetical protein